MMKSLVYAISLSVGMCCLSVKADKYHRVTDPATTKPKSVLVLPPITESTDPMASYSYLSTVTRHLADAGYYVFPVAVIDAFLKENGLPTPYEMHTVKLDRVHEILGAESVLYLTLKKYGQEFQVLSSATVIRVEALLMDVRTGETLWKSHVERHRSSWKSQNDLAENVLSAVLTQMVDSSQDAAHNLANEANTALFSSRKGFPEGPTKLKNIGK